MWDDHPVLQQVLLDELIPAHAIQVDSLEELAFILWGPWLQLDIRLGREIATKAEKERSGWARSPEERGGKRREEKGVEWRWMGKVHTLCSGFHLAG